jgi:hypothetical protein
MKPVKHLILPIFILLLSGCGSKLDLTKKPVDIMIRDMSDLSTFSIILYDMNTEGSLFKKYYHQYRTIREDDKGDPKEDISGWYEVSKEYFMSHIDNMGMEIASKQDGKVTKTVSPPGYGSYVGNQRYGHWVQRNGHSFWAFYGQYAFMSSMFGMMSYPVRRSYYDDYRTNYYGSGRTYYGPRGTDGRSMYGTNSAYTSSRTNSRWNTNPTNNSMKQRVRSSTSRSSRSGSRYSSSSRSRSGGYGK